MWDRFQTGPAKLSLVRQAAFEMFAKGCSVTQVASAVDRAPSTTLQYLVEYIQEKRPESIEDWVDEATYRRVAKTADEVGTRRLRPIFERLGDAIPYDKVRHWRVDPRVPHLETRWATRRFTARLSATGGSSP